MNVVLDNPNNAPIGNFAVGNTGGWTSWRTVPANIARTTGVHIRQTVSFTSTADSPPATATTAPRSVAGACARFSAVCATQRKMPARAISELKIIIPRSRTRVSQLIASRYTCCGVSTPKATMATAPATAPPGRSSLRNGSSAPARKR